MNLKPEDFDFIDCSFQRMCIKNGCWAMNESGHWEWLRNYTVDPSKGFMFGVDPTIRIIAKIMDRIDSPFPIGHSGASFAFTMRDLHYIARNGIEAYKRRYFNMKQKRELGQCLESYSDDE
jgi:hypothetical protein